MTKLERGERTPGDKLKQKLETTFGVHAVLWPRRPRTRRASA
jgi:ribosome-binding protein aMBF1 (putative translation factor)